MATGRKKPNSAKKPATKSTKKAAKKATKKPAATVAAGKSASKDYPKLPKTTQNKADLRRGQVEIGVLEGKTEKEIAADIGISRDRVKQIKAEPDFKARIEARVKEAVSLTANEVIGTLVSHLRSDITDILPDDGGIISEIKANNLGHLVKKIKVKRELKLGLDDGQKVVEQEFEIVDIELYGSQGAAIQLSKVLGLEQQARQNQNDADMRQKISRAIEMLAAKYNMSQEETRELYLQLNPEHEKWM